MKKGSHNRLSANQLSADGLPGYRQFSKTEGLLLNRQENCTDNMVSKTRKQVIYRFSTALSPPTVALFFGQNRPLSERQLTVYFGAVLRNFGKFPWDLSLHVHVLGRFLK